MAFFKSSVFPKLSVAKIENDDKFLFENILDSIVLNVSTAITAFIKATIRENGIPFSLKSSDDLAIYSAETGI
ncbi:MAG: hypothetical protein II811_07665 [Spirochaetaceae bacterium]|nr:hypothetical protein [Spirochaetaceae bacterium]